MFRLDPLPPSFSDTRDELQRVATHVLARRRYELTGRFGLRATPGGIGTPAAGADHEVLRTSGSRLIVERTGEEAVALSIELQGKTLADVAAFAGLDPAGSVSFSVGHDTPPLGDLSAPLAIDPAAAAVLADWFAYAWAVLDEVRPPTVVQIWPEHFDAGCSVGSVNLGAAPGDAHLAVPYLYVGPWGTERPGDPSYWNAPFGAVLGYDDLLATADPVATGVRFLRRGLELLDTKLVS